VEFDLVFIWGFWMCLEVMIHIFSKKNKFFTSYMREEYAILCYSWWMGGMEAFHKEQQEKWEACHL
jgi:hypothetical protein